VKLPEEFDMDKTRKKFGHTITPTTVVLLQELERFNELNSKMNKSLATLIKVNRLFKIYRHVYASYCSIVFTYTLLIFHSYLFYFMQAFTL